MNDEGKGGRLIQKGKIARGKKAMTTNALLQTNFAWERVNTYFKRKNNAGEKCAN